MNEGTQKTDDQWFNEPVTVQVDRDNRNWLDALMEMNQKELQDFAIYRYQVPEAAAKVVGRNELIQMVVMANKAGGGGSVLRTRFRYLNQLAGVIPQYTQKVRGGRSLYLTRGEGDTMQVYDKSRDQWVSAKQNDETAKGRSVDPQLPAGPTGDQTPPSEPTAPQEGMISTETVAGIVADTQQQTLQLMLPAIGKFTRPQLENIVKSLGVDDVSEEKFPTNADLIQFVRNAAGVIEGDNNNSNSNEGGSNDGQNSNGNN